MEKAEITGKTPGQLASYLAMTCEEREIYPHIRPLTEDELIEKRKEFTDQAMDIAKIEIELAVVKKNFKNRLEPLYEKQEKVLGIIEVEEDLFNTECYPIYDFETGFMELYNDQGILVHTRSLTNYEMQLKLAMVDESAADVPFTSISMEDHQTGEVFDVTKEILDHVTSLEGQQNIADSINTKLKKSGSKTKVSVSSKIMN